MATRERTGMRAVNRSRRSVIKAGLAGLVAAGAGRVPIAEASAAAQSARPSAGIAPSARLNGPLFFDVETTNGVVRGMANTGIKVFRGIPYGADTSGAEPLHASTQAGALDGRALRDGLRANLSADAFRLSKRLRAADHVGSSRRLRRHGRRLPVAQRLRRRASTTAASAPCSSRFTAADGRPDPPTRRCTTAASSPCSETSSS